jgi:hypothetical protein
MFLRTLVLLGLIAAQREKILRIKLLEEALGAFQQKYMHYVIP